MGKIKRSAYTKKYKTLIRPKALQREFGRVREKTGTKNIIEKELLFKMYKILFKLI